MNLIRLHHGTARNAVIILRKLKTKLLEHEVFSDNFSEVELLIIILGKNNRSVTDSDGSS